MKRKEGMEREGKERGRKAGTKGEGGCGRRVRGRGERKGLRK